jgi:hypothetical protein
MEQLKSYNHEGWNTYESLTDQAIHIEGETFTNDIQFKNIDSLKLSNCKVNNFVDFYNCKSLVLEKCDIQVLSCVTSEATVIELVRFIYAMIVHLSLTNQP